MIAMKKKVYAVLIILSSLFTRAEVPPVNAQFAQVIDRCRSTKSKKTIDIFLQWHLLGKTTTRGKDFKKFPQWQNQWAIYQQLSKWIAEGQIQAVIAEGCEGEIDSSFTPVFNGWSYQDLQVAARSEKYSEILTHVPLKLEAAYGERVKTICGDNLRLIKKNDLIFSDLRGLIGFEQRIKQSRDNPSRLRGYSKAAAKILKLNLATEPEVVLKSLQDQIRTKIKDLRQTFIDRNEAFVAKVLSSSSDHQAIVIGGVHAVDLKEQLQSRGINCRLIRPKGYKDDADQLLKKLEREYQ